MEKIIGKNTFDVKDEVMMRQMMEIGKLSTKLTNGEITQDELVTDMAILMINKINDNTDKETFNDFILDNLNPDEFNELSDTISGIINKFLKKKETTNTNTKSSGINEVENSVMSGEQS